MVAVYILVACLALSAAVIVAILLYCTSQCWPSSCPWMPWDWVRARRGGGRAGVPAIKISATSVSELNEPPSLVSNNSELERPPWMEPRVVGLMPQKAPASLDSFPSSPTHKLLMDGVFDEGADEAARQLREEPRNGRLSPGADLDPEKRSILHYELDYSSSSKEKKEEKSVLRGSLTFALRYDFIHRVLMAHVLKASHLPQKNPVARYMAGWNSMFEEKSGSCDPYVKLYLLPDMRGHCKTRIHRKTLEPEFNEMFSFDAAYAALSSHMIQFTVYDFDRFTRHDLIGNVIMRDLFEKSDLYTWTEYTMHIVGSNEKDDFGDLLLYLTYSGAEQKLGVSVAKAYNLRPMDITGASDPYVRIEELRGSRRVRKKKTTTKRANLNPVYNETLVFDIPHDAIHDVSLLVTVMDWDRIGSDDLLGCCVIGQASPTAEGREQWQDAMAASLLSPPAPGARKGSTPGGGKAVGRWHSLLAEIPDEFRFLSGRGRGGFLSSPA